MPAVKLRDDGRIQRMIAIAYILSTRTEIHVDELCERLEISREELESDLNVLMFCGLPPYSPEQLFDIFFEDDFVSMYFNDVFIAPLRLSNTEVLQILIALERLKSNNLDSNEIKQIQTTIAKLNRSQKTPLEIEVQKSPFEEIIQEALKEKSSIKIEYLSLNSANIQDRIVLPISIYNTASTSYLLARELSGANEKLFRMDRILDAQLLESSYEIGHESTKETKKEPDLERPVPFMGETDNYVDLVVKDQAVWVLDSIPQFEVDASQNLYRFYTSSPFFVARLLLSNFPHIEYRDGSISKERVISAVEAIKERMLTTKMA